MKNTLYILVSLLLLASCSNEKEMPQPKVEYAPLSFHIHTYLDNYEVDAYDIAGTPIVYTTTEGRKISLTCSQLYVSDIELVKMDGTTYPIKDTVLLVNIANQLYHVGNVPVGNYKSLKFKVGLNPTTNNQLPSTNTSYLNDSKMWFNASATQNEYVFMNCAGKIDTTKNATGLEADMQAFEYKIGTNAHYVSVQMPDRYFTVSLSTLNYVHMYADYSLLFKNIDLTNPLNLKVTSKADNNTQTASEVAANMSSMFVYE